MCHQKKFQLNWLTALEVTATANFDNLQTERDCHILTRTSCAGPSENVTKLDTEHFDNLWYIVFYPFIYVKL